MIKMPVSLTEEQKELIREYAYLESNTPGTINGVDKTRFYEKFTSRRASEQKSERKKENVETEKSEAEPPKADVKMNSDNQGTDAKGTLAKIVDAISENETVKAIKKKIFG